MFVFLYKPCLSMNFYGMWKNDFLNRCHYQCRCYVADEWVVHINMHILQVHEGVVGLLPVPQLMDVTVLPQINQHTDCLSFIFTTLMPYCQLIFIDQLDYGLVWQILCQNGVQFLQVPICMLLLLASFTLKLVLGYFICRAFCRKKGLSRFCTCFPKVVGLNLKCDEIILHNTKIFLHNTSTFHQRFLELRNLDQHPYHVLCKTETATYRS